MFSGFGRKAAERRTAAAAAAPEPEGLARMAADEDMKAEAASLDQAMASLAVGGASGTAAGGLGAVPAAVAAAPLRSVPLNWARGSGGHHPSADTLRMLREAGGREGVRAFTNSFYVKAFADPVIDKFIRTHTPASCRRLRYMRL